MPSVGVLPLHGDKPSLHILSLSHSLPWSLFRVAILLLSCCLSLPHFTLSNCKINKWNKNVKWCELQNIMLRKWQIVHELQRLAANRAHTRTHERTHNVENWSAARQCQRPKKQLSKIINQHGEYIEKCKVLPATWQLSSPKTVELRQQKAFNFW